MPGLIISYGSPKEDVIRLLHLTSQKALSKKGVVIRIFAFLLVLLLVYFIIYNRARSYAERSKGIRLHQNTFVKYNETMDFLINTPGCYIPNYSKTLRFKEAKRSGDCGVRAVFIDKIINESAVQFAIDEEKMRSYTEKIQNVRCCYKFASRSEEKGKEDTDINYSPCELFENGTKAKLHTEYIIVTCTLHLAKQNEVIYEDTLQLAKQSEVIYEDAYLILKKVEKEKHSEEKENNNEELNNSWNVLLLGMDTMSRARVYATMPRSVDYLQQNGWLDYRGYHKVEYNTFPNIMAMITGKNITSSYNACKGGMSECNPLMIWSRFKEAGYRTAFGEDYLRLPDTFCRNNGFRTPPTDHYTRPFFLTGEQEQGNLICAKKLPSALHLLSYAKQFAYEYRDDKFYAQFWLNSYSHNIENSPSRLDGHMLNFFSELSENRILNNTFVFFLSDHGIRYGEMRVPVESFYEERLPMLFIWVPKRFRELYPRKYFNMQINQNRLTTPYDLHETLWSILKISNSSVEVVPSEACPQCEHLFSEKSPQRTCSDAAISRKWCSCYNVVSANRSSSEVSHGLQVAVENMQNLSQSVETVGCKTCSPFRLKRVLRIHTYRDEIDNSTYYVIAFEMSPGDVRYESTVEESGGQFRVLSPTHTISTYNTRGSCVKNRYDRAYCVCSNKNCKKKHYTYCFFFINILLP